MNIHKPLSPKAFRSPRELAQILRTKPRKPDFNAILSQEARSAVVSYSNNTMDYYSISPERKILGHKQNDSIESLYKSVHRSPESKQTQYMLEKLNGPKLNVREKKALGDIRKKKGRLYLLSDLYQEFTKDIEQKFVEEVAPKPKKANRIEVYENTRLVEDLDKWDRELKLKASLSPTSNPKKSTIPALASNSNQQRLAEINQSAVMKKMHKQRSLVASIEDMAQKEIGSKKHSIVEKNGLKIPEADIESIEKLSDKYMSKEDVEKAESIEQVDVDQTDESTQELKDDIIGISGKEIDTEKIHQENTKGMTLQQIVEYYRDIGEKQEERIERKIRKYEGIIKDQEELILNIKKDDDILERQTRQVSKQLELVEEAQNMKTVFAAHGGRKYVKPKDIAKEAMKSFEYDPNDENNPENTRKRELKQNLEILNKRTQENATDLADAENLLNVTQQKIRGLITTRVSLYRNILMQGMDTREEGLTWVLKKIIDAGEQVLIADFPPFLDYKSRKFLLEKAKAQRELAEIKKIEKASMEVFKTSRDMLFGNDIRFSNLFKPNFRDMIINGSGTTSPAEFASQVYLNTSGDDKLPGTQSPIYLEDTLSRNGDSQVKTWQEKESPELASFVSKRTWTEGDLGANEKFTKKTENEEIYSKARDLIKNMQRGEERKGKLEEKTGVSGAKKAKKVDDDIMDDHVKLYQDNIFVNNYKSRKEFIMKMQSLSIEQRTKQAKINEETDKEAIRIITEYGANMLDKQVDLDVYLMSLFGYSEASKYLNRIGAGERQVI